MLNLFLPSFNQMPDVDIKMIAYIIADYTTDKPFNYQKLS